MKTFRMLCLSSAVALGGCAGWTVGPATTPDAEGNVRVSCSEAGSTPSPCSAEAYRACGGPADIVGAPQPLVLGDQRSPQFYQYSATYHCR